MHRILMILTCVAAACSAPEPPDDHTASLATESLMGADAIATRFATGSARFQVNGARHLGLRLDGDLGTLEFRTHTTHGASAWRAVDVTWSEGNLHVARAGFDPASSIELRGASGLTALVAEFSAKAPGDRLTRDLPLAFEGPYATLERSLAPDGMVISRADWGARDPGKICGSVVAPYRMSVHHTDVPADDGGDAAARTRQMQAFHIDTRGWCDIGYHFVVSQAGDLYQGRSDERRPGAHVGGENAGNIGISFIGDFDEQQVNPAQFAAGARIMGWAIEEYGVPANRNSIKGHQEWPGQATSCPGQNLLGRLEELIEDATGDRPEPPDPPDPPDPPADADVRYSTRWLQTPGDRNRQGSSGGIPDGFVGESFQAVFTIENRSASPIRGVRLGYAFGPGWRATNYVIETDHPARDRMTWMVNDADSAPDNPAKDGLGQDGSLTMYAFGQQETKRVVVDLEFADYGGWRSPVQGWVAQVDGVYTQASFSEAPSLNVLGERLQGQVDADVLAPDAWRFPAPEGDDVEGWSACPDGAPPTQLDGVMAVVDCAKSPGWSAIDADRWDALVFRMPAAETSVVLQWVGGAAEFPVASVVEPVVVDLSGVDTWAGEVRGLRVNGRVWIDALWPQSVARVEPGVAHEPFVPSEPVQAIEPTEPLPILDAAVPDMGPPPGTDAGSDAEPFDDPDFAGGTDGTLEADGGDAGGCQQSPSPAWWMTLLLPLVRRRR